MIDAMWKLIRWCEYLRKRRPVRRRWGSVAALCLGPVWDHTLCAMVNDLRVCARYARARTDTPTVRDLGKWVTAIYWGSSGRRFKSCQPDLSARPVSARPVKMGSELRLFRFSPWIIV
jgi:hypothetical protein